MLYRLFTLIENRTFTDFMELLEHIESKYGYCSNSFFTTETGNPAYSLYNSDGIRIGYYEII